MDTTKGPNKALYYTVALITMIATVLGAVVYVSTRPGNLENTNIIIAGIFTFVGPAVAALLALMASLNNAEQTHEIKHKVNGTLTNLADKNAQLVQQVVDAQTTTTNTAQGATNTAQAANVARAPYSGGTRPGGA